MSSPGALPKGRIETASNWLHLGISEAEAEAAFRDASARRSLGRIRAAILLGLYLERVLDQARVLKGLLPVCAWCSRIRDEAGGWLRMEDHLARHSQASFSHGICPDCGRRFREEAKAPSRRA